MLRYFILGVWMISCVLALGVDLDCPDEIYTGEEFECFVEVSDGDGVYDLKIDLDGERNSVLEVWNAGAWKSGYYYLVGFIEDEERVRLRVSEEGDYEGVLKLRQGDKREFFDVEIEIGESRENGTRMNADERGSKEEAKVENVYVETKEDSGGVISLNAGEVVVLNGHDSGEPEEELVYVSRDARIVGWLPYGFCLFLICLVGILLWDRTSY
ncbi:hypothetical protein HNV12_03385 [Methanococcoides sp. SA1]|nr:hypothetical protein [Methanococcoides sp. SA1]